MEIDENKLTSVLRKWRKPAEDLGELEEELYEDGFILFTAKIMHGKMIERRVDVKKEIIEILEEYPEGIHVNALAEECKDFVSRVTLLNRLIELERDSEVFYTPKKLRRGQRKFYRLTDSFIEMRARAREVMEKLGLKLNDVVLIPLSRPIKKVEE